jgi:hypothetical protein
MDTVQEVVLGEPVAVSVLVEDFAVNRSTSNLTA